MATEIGTDRVEELREEGAQLVDVLPAEAYRREHIPGAINIPLTEIASASKRLVGCDQLLALRALERASVGICGVPGDGEPLPVRRVGCTVDSTACSTWRHLPHAQTPVKHLGLRPVCPTA